MMGNEGHISPMAGMQVAFDALVCLCLYLCIHLCLCLRLRVYLCLCLRLRVHLCLCLRLMTVSWRRGWWGWTTCSTTAWAMAWTGWTMGCRWPPSTWPRLELALAKREIIWKIKIREKDKHDDNSPIPDERDGEPKHDESWYEGDDEHEQRNAGINLSFLSFIN